MKTANKPATGIDAMDYDAFLLKMGERDRLNVSRHVTALEAEPTDDHVKLWKRVACALATLSPHAIQTTGQHALRYFVADGKYRKQMFALEDTRDGSVAIYTADSLDDAVKAGILIGKLGEGPTPLKIKGEPSATLMVERLSVAATTSAPDYYRHMLGWNRKALKITLPTSATAAQVKAAEALCALAARKNDGAGA